jgi:hypothetical protein
MPVYYFQVHNGQGHTPDDEGQDLPDIEEARAVAMAGIRSLLGEELAAGSMDFDGRIDVTDEKGNVLLSLCYSDAVEIHHRSADA